MAITTFAQRQKAEHIYKTYFDQESEHHIGIGMLDTLLFYDAISQKDFTELVSKVDEISETLLEKISDFDISSLQNK